MFTDLRLVCAVIFISNIYTSHFFIVQKYVQLFRIFILSIFIRFKIKFSFSSNIVLLRKIRNRIIRSDIIVKFLSFFKCFFIE